MKHNHTTRFLLCLGVALALFCTNVFAQIPRTLSYQGVLSGNNLPNGLRTVTFRLYTQSVGGTAIWEETQSVKFTAGVFSVVLGEVTPFPDSARFDTQYWLGIQLIPKLEMTPRVKLTSSAYSFNSLHADTAGVAMSAGPPSRPISPPISNGEIADHAVSLSKIDTSGAQQNQVITFAGNAVTWGTPSGGGGLSLPYSGQVTAGGGGQAALSITNSASSGLNYGLAGYSASPAGIGMYGEGNYGVYGNSASIIGAGVEGVSTASGGIGVRGSSQSSDGWGVYGSGSQYGVGGTGAGPSGIGVSGLATSGTGPAYGVSGVSYSDSGAGVYGTTISSSGVGVHGSVIGDGLKYGVLGENNSNTFNAAGVRGYASGSGQVIGVEGVAPYGTGTGVVGRGSATGGYFEALGSSGNGDPAGTAGYFAGKVIITGDLQVDGNISGATAWNNLALASGLTGDAQFRKIGDVVYLRGSINGYNGNNSTEVIGNLPANEGMWPPSGRTYVHHEQSINSELWITDEGVLIVVQECGLCFHSSAMSCDGVFFSTTP